jgi:serine O-acetyltransferase
MILSLSAFDLTRYTVRQINNFFPEDELSASALKPFVKAALERIEHCFSRINIKYFSQGEQAVFNHLHTDQYAMFLYFLCNTIHRMNGDPRLSGKVYALNKALHSIDVFYEVELPEIFCFQHPIGTVLGRANYSDYFFVYQRCSVGSSLDQGYPQIGECVVMFGNSAIVGDSKVGENCWLSFGTIVMDQNIPSNTVTFGRSPELIIKPTQRNVMRDLFLKG